MEETKRTILIFLQNVGAYPITDLQIVLNMKGSVLPSNSDSNKLIDNDCKASTWVSCPGIAAEDMYITRATLSTNLLVQSRFWFSLQGDDKP